MTSRLCIPPATFEDILQANPHLVVEADETTQYVELDGVEYSTPLLPIGGAE